MGCGLTRTSKNQKEIVEDLKKEMFKTEEEIKKLDLEKDKVEAPGVEVRKPEEIKKHIDNLSIFLNCLKDIDAEIEKDEYDSLGQLQDLLDVLYTFPGAMCFEEIPRQHHKIKDFLSSNVKIKVVRKQNDLMEQIESSINKANEEIKKDKIDLARPDYSWLLLFLQQYNSLLNSLKDNRYKNLPRLQEIIISYNKSKDSRSKSTISECFKQITNFLEKNKVQV